MTTQTIPLVREAIFEAFINAARNIGCPVEKYLHAVKLPGELSGNPETLLPELQCWQFINLVANREKLDTLGLMTGTLQTHTELLALLKQYFADCINLNELLKRFCIVVPMLATAEHYVLEEDGDILWFIQKGPRLVSDDIQVELFQVLGMIQLVQVVAGKQWRPPQTRFTFSYRKAIEHAEELNPSQLHFSQAYPAIAIPRQLLSLELAASKASLVNSSAKNNTVLPTPDSFVDSLRCAISPYLGDQAPDINLAAELSGIHVRTLQRRLAQQNMTYSAIVEQARLLKAKSLLNEKSLKLLDITLMLGYSEPATFTRAFRRWAGVSPSEYRKYQLAQAKENFMPAAGDE
jgi:AraC-like DNA-binding protein